MKRLTFALSLGLALANSVQAATLEILTDDNPPFSYMEGKAVAGVATDIVREMAKRAGIDINITVADRDESYRNTQAATDSCLYALARAPDREALFKWVGPVLSNKWAVFGKADFSEPVRSLYEMKKFRIAAESFDGRIDYLRQNGFNGILQDDVDTRNPPRLFLKKEDSNYADLWLTGIYSAKKRAAAAKVPELKLVYTLRDIPLYLACSAVTQKALVEKLTTALEAMKKDGSLAKMQAKLVAP
ncbi:MAG: transporter substrate-binding domain-containing protein [Betaproteobacteria bacterium]|nr:transporter substrate-binding domain-containing protein [Betaproteobacteria bacterium]